MEDNMGLIWIGTRAGLYQYNEVSGTLKHYLHDEDDINSLYHNYIRTINFDKQGAIWICASNLHKYDPVNDNFTRELSDPNNPDGPGHNQVFNIHESDQGLGGTYWIGTDIGLFKYDRAAKTFTHFTDKDGLPHMLVRDGVLEDKHNNLWILTANGLSKLNPNTNAFKNYDTDDGLHSSYYWELIQNKNGEIFVGGSNGLSIFHPDSIQDDAHVPPIVLTRFKKFHKDVQLDSSLSYVKKLFLDHNENTISFEFAALNFTNPEKNQFVYKMEGFDNDWIYNGNKHEATYTHLPPGEYVFRVKGSNHDGVWNEEGASLNIIISAPWWKTRFAFLVYLILFGLLLFSLRRIQINRIKMKHELEMEHLHAEKLLEIDHMKSRFFTNISHEFRTPLTLILGPIQKILHKIKDSEIQQDLNMMQRNARRLLELINQLLDLSKLEAGRMRLQVQNEDIAAMVNRIVQAFESQAKLKGIRLRFRTETEKIWAFIDIEKMENVIINLVSNALKFTPHGGVIEVAVITPKKKHLSLDATRDQIFQDLSRGSEHLQPATDFVEITISDTGPGIPKEMFSKVFDRFYQVDESITRKHEGTGIGLALCKELIELHRGSIHVYSEQGRGASFLVKLPLGKNHLSENEIVRPESVNYESTTVENVTDVVMGPQDDPLKKEAAGRAVKDKQKDSIRRNGRTLLIVEDSQDLRTYLRESLENNYKIVEAKDGLAGFNKGVEIIPELVISDVMMPKMDGIELCRKFKTDRRTSHIPVILLTARADADSKIEGYETGADDYIAKPFVVKELEVRVENLIEQRRRFREKFLREITVQPSDITVTSIDETFLIKVIDLVEKNMNNDEFDTAVFAREIGMSRGHLNAKLKALTGYASREFIRSVRLKRAAQLLQQQYGNITEVAYRVGFNSLSHFSKAFRDTFGVLPSGYNSKDESES